MDELTKRNEEKAAEIESLKIKLQASKASYTPGLQGSGCEHNQSGVSSFLCGNSESMSSII
jgi:hypothetical protein